MALELGGGCECGTVNIGLSGLVCVTDESVEVGWDPPVLVFFCFFLVGLEKR